MCSLSLLTLSLQSIDALARALALWPGGVLLVSHDQAFLTAISNELWVVSTDGRVAPFDGTFEDYKRRLLAKR